MAIRGVDGADLPTVAEGVHLSSLSIFQPRSSSQSSRPCCQICSRMGHIALDYFHRMDYSYQGRNPPSQLAAMAASSYSLPDQTWFADSGATNHIANDVRNLSVHSDYQGTDKVIVGNGKGLKILQSSSSLVQTSNSRFQLHNILHVLDISTNLLSVNQFARDNDCVFVFSTAGFTIQDRMSGRILFQGLSSNELYPFHGSISPSHPTALLGATTSANVWHQRLGHPSSAALHHILLAPSFPLKGSSVL